MSAQTNKEEVEFFQSLFGMEKKAIVTSFVQLEGEAADGFWILYDEYETSRKEHGVKRIDLLKSYRDNYMELDEFGTDEIINEMMSLSKEYDKLINKYYKKIKKVAGSVASAQFYQIEGYFRSAIRLSILGEIPFIGELDSNE